MSRIEAPIGPDLRAALVAMVRKRVPESEVEDIVQASLAEAFESPHAPRESEALRRWLFGVAKHKVIDYHRRAGRETFELPELAGSPAPHAEADLLRWAERNIPQGTENQKTLDWMLREGEGEKLESIAESERMPAPRVRQRVSRLRRHLKDNWQREVALLAALGVIITALVLFLGRRKEPELITHDTPDSRDPRAEPIRKAALERCARSEWAPCIEGLDEAKRLDRAGDDTPRVRDARAAAGKALAPAPSSDVTPPLPTTAPPSPSSTSSSSLVPVPTAAPPKPSPKTTSLPEPFDMKQAPQKMDGLAPPDSTAPPPPRKVAPTAKPSGASLGLSSDVPEPQQTQQKTNAPTTKSRATKQKSMDPGGSM